MSLTSRLVYRWTLNAVRFTKQKCFRFLLESSCAVGKADFTCYRLFQDLDATTLKERLQRLILMQILICTCESKKSPCGFLTILSEKVGNF